MALSWGNYISSEGSKVYGLRCGHLRTAGIVRRLKLQLE